LSLKENIDKLLEIQAKITNAENKIKFQQEEIIKTVDIIDKFKKCYDDQNEALGKVWICFSYYDTRLIKLL